MTNLCVLKGRLCKYPELSTTTSGMSVCRIRIAVPRRDKKRDRFYHLHGF